jgi:hypothetical protein
MAIYQIHFKANPALWPTDPKEKLAISEGAFQGADDLLAAGAMQEVCWVSASEGYARVEASSAAGALAICAMFFPMFTQEIQELVPWNVAKEAILGAVRQAVEQ